MYKYLIFQTEQEALDRADVEGQALNLPYWQDPTVNTTRATTAPIRTDDGEWGLDVTDYTTLTDEEEAVLVDELNINLE
jgi:hypothetical protein